MNQAITKTWRRQIRRLLDEPGLLDRLRQGCQPPRTLDEDVDATRALYQQLVSRLPDRAAGRLLNVSPSAVRSVAAVLLNYRTAEQTAMAAEMLLRSNTPPAPLIVVDNGDGVACGAALAALGRRVTMRATGANLGFSGGCNHGIREALAAGADAVLLVNSDVIVPPDCVSLLMAALREQATPGIVAPVVCSRVWPDRVLSAGIDYDIATGRMRHRLERAEGATVTAVSGCAMLVHRAVFDRIGLLPEEYFFSFEDIAFCQRARAAGFDIGLAPRATVYHEGSGRWGTTRVACTTPRGIICVLAQKRRRDPPGIA